MMARSFGQLTITSLKRGDVEQVARISGGLRHVVTLSWDEQWDLYLVTYSKNDGPIPRFQSMYWFSDVDLARARFTVDSRSF